MIISLTKSNIDILDNSFIDKNKIKKELEINPFARILLLIENNEIIGYLYYSDIYERAEINQFEVNTIHRNCGKGKMLLQELIRIVDKDITLEVRIDNYSAIHLYESNGFKRIATRKQYYNGTDGILMERKNK